jgi:hypothetical protein
MSTTMAFNNPQSVPATAPMTSTTTTTHIDSNGTPWLTTSDPHLLALSQYLSISTIQAQHFPTFTTTQLSTILSDAKA